MMLLYTLPEQPSCTLSQIISGPWRKFRLRILFCSHFTSSYMLCYYRLWGISKHGIGDIHERRSFHTRIREKSTASRVLNGSHKRDGGLKNQHSFHVSGKESVLDMSSSTGSTEGYCCHVSVKAISSALYRRACHSEATSMPRLAVHVLCNSRSPGCWTPQSQYLLSKWEALLQYNRCDFLLAQERSR
jgi:hypothetical protein